MSNEMCISIKYAESDAEIVCFMDGKWKNCVYQIVHWVTFDLLNLRIKGKYIIFPDQYVRSENFKNIFLKLIQSTFIGSRHDMGNYPLSGWESARCIWCLASWFICVRCLLCQYVQHLYKCVCLTKLARFYMALHINYTWMTYSISQEICTRFCCALLCCGYAIVHNEFTWSIYPYSSGLLCWHWGNR